MPAESANSNRMLDRITAILDAVDGGAASATELAHRTSLSVSTAHRLAQAMANYDYLARTPSGDFRLGPRFIRSPLLAIAEPALAELRDETGETAQLWVRRGSQRVCQVSADSRSELRVTLARGSSLPLPAGSSGRILAGLPEALQAIDENGWDETDSERTPGLASVSAPVRAEGAIVATVCLAVPVSRIRTTVGQDYGPQVSEAARRITEALAI
ncbi:IclR family transcriptional regulator [Arthrobacter sulfonylureivorans]|uniref:IclR family transcriptional regulator n=1 Tax=Arthrobacter sulfonylureivorans TaxID=2486855 RepID=A0ABY3W9R4_9MICC|nr:IclR family transcriptional regulator [Arthrobacter sulfonylureivorans]UNK46226.1 IclR family transcriptional regulator [Arthrobacter sulfonylureivorans]